MEKIDWLLSEEPWTHYCTLVDLLECSDEDSRVLQARQEMVVHPQVRGLIASASNWGGRALKRHNDASHPLYAISTLADFGLCAGDQGMVEVVAKVQAHQSPQGAHQTLTFVPEAFGGLGEDTWSWMACDAPTLLYALLAFGLRDDPGVEQAATHLESLASDNGYRCVSAPELGGFRGPGRREDPCPIANVYALKALSLLPDLSQSEAAQRAAEMLLDHWEQRRGRKYYLFGMGTDFCKLKYPFVWYDILHVVEVLSRLAFVHHDPRFQEMVRVITQQGDALGRYTASSMYQSWKGWSFADKKKPSPWLTFLVERIRKRIND